MNIHYFEVLFSNFYSVLIKAIRVPSFEEAAEFLRDDMKELGVENIILIEEWTEEDARTAFDFNGSENWHIFGI